MLRAINARVLRAHAAEDVIPLTLNKGDHVQVRQAHPDRAGYVWAEDGQISGGWVPLDLLDLNSGVPRARAVYCSSELTVAEGDVVRLMWEDAAHGAWWCEDNAGERGWVRREALQIDE
jgi:plastocyanin